MLSQMMLNTFAALVGHIVAVLQPDVLIAAVSENTGKSIAKTARSFIEPLLFLGVGIAALTFLFKRQMTQFFQFAAIAALIGMFWFKGEDIIKAIGNFLGGLF